MCLNYCMKSMIWLFRLRLGSVFGLLCSSEACFQWHKIDAVLNLLFLSSGCVLTTYNISANPFWKGFCGSFACSDNKRSHALAMKWLLKDKTTFEAKTTFKLICRYRQHATVSWSLFTLFCTAGPNVWDCIEKLGFFHLIPGKKQRFKI